jgi:hypothetical protein
MTEPNATIQYVSKMLNNGTFIDIIMDGQRVMLRKHLQVGQRVRVENLSMNEQGVATVIISENA